MYLNLLESNTILGVSDGVGEPAACYGSHDARVSI
jgi:hypothetical protein